MHLANTFFRSWKDSFILFLAFFEDEAIELIEVFYPGERNKEVSSCVTDQILYLTILISTSRIDELAVKKAVGTKGYKRCLFHTVLTFEDLLCPSKKASCFSKGKAQTKGFFELHSFIQNTFTKVFTPLVMT